MAFYLSILSIIKLKSGTGSTEDLRPEEVLSGRSTPLARPRKETPGQPLRTNRYIKISCFLEFH